MNTKSMGKTPYQASLNWHDNLAREISPAQRPQRVELPRTTVPAERTQAAPKQKSKIRPSWIFAFMAVTALYFLLVSGYMQLTEISVENAAAKAKISDMQKQITAMATTNNERVSFNAIEDAAEAAGMMKLNRDQIEYLNIDNPDVMEVTDGTTKDSEGSYFLDGIVAGFSTLMEYIS